jgi:uncharacterized RDD family membrane protein YckC
MSDPAHPQGPYQNPGSAPPAPYGASAAPVRASGAPLASYGQRVGAYLIDGVIALVALVPGYILFFVGAAAGDNGNGALVALGGLLIVVGALFTVWNVGWRQGATGQSIGKGVMKINLVRLADGVPPGGGVGLGRFFIRQVLAGITGIYGLLTLLWPLWDERRQTLDDKIVGTLVVEAR